MTMSMDKNPNLKTLLHVGAHLGHNVKRTHPEMNPYIYGSRNGQAIINLDHTVVSLKQSLSILSNVKDNGGKILFVDKQDDTKHVTKKVAMETGNFHVDRWTNGLLTNWDVQRTYIDTFYQRISEGTLGKGRKS